MKTLSHSPHNPNDEELLYQEYVDNELKKSKKQFQKSNFYAFLKAKAEKSK